jgi:hypothetical protein
VTTEERAELRALTEALDACEAERNAALANVAAWESMPSYGQGYFDAEESFRPMLERMAHGLTMDGEALTVGQYRTMSQHALRQLDEKKASISPEEKPTPTSPTEERRVWGVSGRVRVEGEEEQFWWGVAYEGSMRVTAVCPERHDAEFLAQALNAYASAEENLPTGRPEE